MTLMYIATVLDPCFLSIANGGLVSSINYVLTINFYLVVGIFQVIF